MKNTKISELPMIPEKYETDHYAQIDYVDLQSEMTDEERRFINGLIRWYEPENILEIGVSRGGGTVNILNAISDMDAKLVSIDRAKTWWVDENHLVGEDVAKSGVPTGKWRLITGVDPSEVLDELDVMFDFCVIDTTHEHPVENLNFLCALPFLNDGAIVALHDITCYLFGDIDRYFANRILMMTVCAEKLEPISVSATGYPNIVAFQVTQDTRKYVRNIFDSLMMPWEMAPSGLEKVNLFIDKHYPAELVSYYYQAVGLQKRIPFIKQIGGFLLKTNLEPPLFTAFDDWRRLGDGVIFYGAGRGMRYLPETGRELGWCFNYPIWDINAEQIGAINGHPVSLPDFESPAKPGQRVVITIDDKQVFSQVRGQLVHLGYRVFHGLRELADDIRNPLYRKGKFDWGEMLGND